MNKLTAEKCREQFEEWFRLNHDSQLITKGDGYSNPVNQLMWQAWQASRQALEIALQVLEQQESDGDTFIVMRNPGKVPDIKRPVGDLADYLLQLYQHNPDAVCDVVTYRFSGISGQWVQDGRELLAMAGVVLEQQGGWISCSERMPPSKTGVLVGCWYGREWATKWASLIHGHPDASNEGWLIPGASWVPTHWHPLPASPQQAQADTYRVIENDGREG